MEENRYSAPMLRACTVEGEEFRLVFPFEPVILTEVKGIFPGLRRWEEGEKAWYIKVDFETAPVVARLVKRWEFETDDAVQAIFAHPPLPEETCVLTVDLDEREFVLAAPYYKPIRDDVRRIRSRFDSITKTWRFPFEPEEAKKLANLLRKRKIQAVSEAAKDALSELGERVKV